MAQFADVVEIDAPAEAVAGAPVNITVRIKNLYSDLMSIMVVGSLEYGVSPWPNVVFPVDWATLGPDEVFEFAGSFTMPGSQVTLHAYSAWYGDDGSWYFDDEMTQVVGVSQASQLNISNFAIKDFAKV